MNRTYKMKAQREFRKTLILLIIVSAIMSLVVLLPQKQNEKSINIHVAK
ncbi:hypothetical protein [Mucilaginibacter sp.]